MGIFFVNPVLLCIVRIVRIGRVLRFVKGTKGIRKLLFALEVSMPVFFKYWSTSFSSDVYLFNIWNVIFCLCEKISWDNKFI